PPNKRRDEAAGEQRPAPHAAPSRIGPLGAILEADAAKDEGSQYHEHGEVESGETDRIERRPGGKDRATPEDEPDLVALPHRPDRVDGDAAFRVRPGNERQERGDAHVEAVGGGKADQQHAEQYPPDELQGTVVDELVEDHWA